MELLVVIGMKLFDPEAPVTRGQFSAFLARAFEPTFRNINNQSEINRYGVFDDSWGSWYVDLILDGMVLLDGTNASFMNFDLSQLKLDNKMITANIEGEGDPFRLEFM